MQDHYDTPNDRPARRITTGRILLAAVAVWGLARFTAPGNWLVGLAWDVLSAGWFWTVATFAVAGYLALIVVRKLSKIGVRAAHASQRGAEQARSVGEHVRVRRHLRRRRADERREIEHTLSDIRSLPEARHARRDR